MLSESALLQARLTRILPHIVDSILLLSAIALVIMSGQYPFRVDWVTLKIFLLLLYIGLGTFALKRGRTKKIRGIYFVAALICIVGIFTAALLKPNF